MSRQPLHATAVARFGPGGWRGVLISGPSGSGKSDLALRLMGRGWRLVADDYCLVWRSGERLYGRAPETIAHRIEARGIGIIAAPGLVLAPLALIVEGAAGPVERMPEPRTRRIEGIDLPFLALALTHASAAEVVASAVDALSPRAALA